MAGEDFKDQDQTVDMIKIEEVPRGSESKSISANSSLDSNKSFRYKKKSPP